MCKCASTSMDFMSPIHLALLSNYSVCHFLVIKTVQASNNSYNVPQNSALCCHFLQFHTDLSSDITPDYLTNSIISIANDSEQFLNILPLHVSNVNISLFNDQLLCFTLYTYFSLLENVLSFVWDF